MGVWSNEAVSTSRISQLGLRSLFRLVFFGVLGVPLWPRSFSNPSGRWIWIAGEEDGSVAWRRLLCEFERVLDLSSTPSSPRQLGGDR